MTARVDLPQVAVGATRALRRERPWRRLAGPAYLLVVGAVTSLLTVPLLHLVGVHLAVPFDYSGDAVSGSVHLKTVLEHGWIDYNPRIGAPAGRHGNDFPGADNLHLMIAWLLGLLIDRWSVVLNAYFLLTFPLAAMAAAWFFRVVGVGRLLAGVLAVLFAFAPYHFYRGESHLYLAAYYPVPLAAVLLYRAVAGESLWSRRTDGRWLGRWLTWRNAGTTGVLVVLGTASSYYSIFALLLFTIATLVALLQDRRWRRVGGVIVAQGLLVAVMLANMAPNLLYQRAHGTNLVALGRSPRLSEYYAMKLSSLLLPWEDHRIRALAHFRGTYDGTFPLRSESPALGLVAAAGLVLLLAVAVLGMTTVASRVGTPSAWWHRQRRLATLAVASFMMGTVGGLSTFFALFVSDSVRGWNRLSIYLAAFALASVGLVLDRSVGALRSRQPRVAPFAAGLLALVVLTVGLYDQTPARYPKDRAKVVAAFGSDSAFVAEIERRLPPSAMVFQLPYLRYPESRGKVDMRDSDPFRMYLSSRTLRWSYGGIHGRPDADWSVDVSVQPAQRMAAFVTAAGFDGIEIDRYGYKDRAAALEGGLRPLLGPPAVVSPDRRFAFWDTRPYAEALRARHSATALSTLASHVLLHPVAYGVDFRTGHPRVAFDNPLPTAQTVDATLRLIAPNRPSAVVLTWPDGTRETVSATSGNAVFTRRITLSPGRTFAQIATDPAASTKGGLRPDEVRYRLGHVDLPDEVLKAFTP